MPALTIQATHSGKLVAELCVAPGRIYAEALRSFGGVASAPRHVIALIDTGASRTVVEEAILSALRLTPIGEEDVLTASSGSRPVTAQLYGVELDLAGDVTGRIASDLPVVAAKDLSGLGVQALLGRDVLMEADWSYDRSSRTFRLAIDDRP